MFVISDHGRRWFRMRASHAVDDTQGAGGNLDLQPLADAEINTTSVTEHEGEVLPFHDIQDSVLEHDRQKCSINNVRESSHCPPALDEDNQWEVEKLLRKRKCGRSFEYEMKRLGYPESANEWVKEKHISSELVKAFEA